MGVRVIAIEAAPAVTRQAAEILRSRGFDVRGTAATGEDGLALARRERPDIALVDLALPDQRGEDVIAAIREELPRTACIAVTDADEPARVLGAMRAGASGCVPKPSHARELAQSIEAVLAGEDAPMHPRIAKALVRGLRGDPRTRGPSLSKRELAVLQLLVHGHTYADVAKAFGIAESTVRVYERRIEEKSGEASRPHALAASRPALGFRLRLALALGAGVLAAVCGTLLR